MIYAVIFLWLAYLTYRLEKFMSTSPVTRQQLDDAITELGTAITTAITDLEAKIASGTVVTPDDFSQELANLKGIIAQVGAADPGPTPTPTPAPSV